MKTETQRKNYEEMFVGGSPGVFGVPFMPEDTKSQKFIWVKSN